ncbi:MAG: LysR family transcriptional regulator [Verrucomicrobiaceae bacterium]|nr:MAG: LysR family transcriptional regulator [Verrucomicrobiaceae bacterium]
MELRHLKYFSAVAEEENISRAAARLHVSQPPLSRQIRDLEEELGVELLERGAKSVRLTPAGRIFAGEARAVLDRVEAATQAVQAFAKGGLREIDIGYSPSLTVELLPHALREFQNRAPGVRVALHDLSTEQILDGLRKETLHAALTIQPPPKSMTGLEFEELRKYAVRVAAHPAHPLAKAKRVTLAILAAERLIGYSKRDYPEYHQWIAELFPVSGPRPEIAEEHDGATSLIAAVETGRGVALVPESFSCLTGARLKLRPLHPAVPDFPVGIIRRKGRLDPAVETFLTATRLMCLDTIARAARP